MLLRYHLTDAEQMTRLGREIRKLLRDHVEPGLMIEVDRYRPPASNKQTAKIEAMISDVAASTKNDQKAMREYVREHFLPRVTMQLERECVSVSKSFANLTRAEASDVIEQLYALGAEYGVAWSEP